MVFIRRRTDESEMSLFCCCEHLLQHGLQFSQLLWHISLIRSDIFKTACTTFQSFNHFCKWKHQIVVAFYTEQMHRQDSKCFCTVLCCFVPLSVVYVEFVKMHSSDSQLIGLTLKTCCFSFILSSLYWTVASKIHQYHLQHTACTIYCTPSICILPCFCCGITWAADWMAQITKHQGLMAPLTDVGSMTGRPRDAPRPCLQVT